MKLFAIYIGGEHPRANIEVHDIRFVVAASITETYDQLRAEWWGKPGTLHLDCWAELTHADGYDIQLCPGQPAAVERLYFVNLGGYDPANFGEQHKAIFVVATSIAEAKAKALRSVVNWADPHRDDLYEAEHAFALDTMFAAGLRIHLKASDRREALRFTSRFTPLK